MAAFLASGPCLDRHHRAPQHAALGCSSTGRAAVSNTAGCRFDSCHPSEVSTGKARECAPATETCFSLTTTEWKKQFRESARLPSGRRGGSQPFQHCWFGSRGPPNPSHLDGLDAEAVGNYVIAGMIRTQGACDRSGKPGPPAGHFELRDPRRPICKSPRSSRLAGHHWRQGGMTCGTGESGTGVGCAKLLNFVLRAGGFKSLDSHRSLVAQH